MVSSFDLALACRAGWPCQHLEKTTMPTGTVKWFNTTKGYGFIEPEDGSGDVFVHASAVERAGLGTLREGDRVRYESRPGRNGRESAEDLSRLEAADRAPTRHEEFHGPPSGVGATRVGTVKWFDTAKGFGFIAPDDGSPDSFVHISAVERAGLGTLREGQRVNYELRPGRNGKFSAENLSIAY